MYDVDCLVKFWGGKNLQAPACTRILFQFEHHPNI